MRACQIALIASVAALLVLLACSGGTAGAGATANCASKGACPNDPNPTPAEIDQCMGLVDDPACGGLFQTYFACAAQHEKCTSAGTVDDSATSAAIQAGCADPIAHYKTCTSTTSTPACGAMGMPCCTGSLACMGGCCDQGTQRCVGFLQPCSAAGQRCSASPSSCVACGSPGQPCCAGDCDQGCCIGQGDAGAGSDPGVCIAAGQSCPAFGGLAGICTFSAPRGFCTECGLTSGPCCPGGVCQNPLTCTGNTCQ